MPKSGQIGRPTGRVLQEEVVSDGLGELTLGAGGDDSLHEPLPATGAWASMASDARRYSPANQSSARWR